MGSNPTGGSSLFSLTKRESEPSQLVVLCCLALFIVSQLFNHAHVHVHVHVYHKPSTIVDSLWSVVGTGDMYTCTCTCIWSLVGFSHVIIM